MLHATAWLRKVAPAQANSSKHVPTVKGKLEVLWPAYPDHPDFSPCLVSVKVSHVKFLQDCRVKGAFNSSQIMAAGVAACWPGTLSLDEVQHNR